MTTPTLLKRQLVFHFLRAAAESNGHARLMYVSVVPLENPSGTAPDMTLVGGGEQHIALSQDDNVVTFDLVPTDTEELTERVLYRASWREGFLGRLFTQDFVMPDADVAWDQIVSGELGGILGNEMYLRQEDLGVHVARLDDAGQVLNGDGDVVDGTAEGIRQVQNNLDAEAEVRNIGDQQTIIHLEGEIETQVSDLRDNVQSQIDDWSSNIQQAIITEAVTRQGAYNELQGNINQLSDVLSNDVEYVNGLYQDILSDMTGKADLDGTGKIPLEQIPTAAITGWIPVGSVNEMLALRYPEDVHLGDVVLTPNGVYGLLVDVPGDINSWYLLNKVQSVNGKQGVVVLTAANVGAVDAATGVIGMNQVTGLTSALNNKAAASAVTSLTTTVNGILNDPTTVKTTGGVISDSVLPADIALINNNNQVTTKNGTVVSTGGGNVLSVNNKQGIIVLTAADVNAIAVGATLPITQIAGLQTALEGKVGTSDGRLSNARTPTSHAGTHGAGQSDPVTLEISQITGLPTLISGNGLTNVSNFANRISTLETEVAGGAGGEGGVSGEAVFWVAAEQTQDLSTVVLHSPFGIDSDGTITSTIGAEYIDPAGVRPADAAYPYITPRGHLKLRQWNELAPDDDVYALQSDLTSLAELVGDKANESDLSAVQDSVAEIQLELPTKADLDLSGKILVNQLPSIPQSQITNLSTTFAAKADLDGNSKILVNQLPSIPQNQITNLGNTFSGKADLAAGVLTAGQIPFSVIPHPQTVANRAAMLALTTAQVHVGDICVISSGVDQGTYQLRASDPSQFANWTQFPVPPSGVTSVNGKAGPSVVLTASDVGALGTTEFQNIMSSSTQIKQVADYVSTSPIVSLAGQQSVDGVLVPVGKTVFLTAQASSIQNGLWVVASGAWSRASDMASGSFFVRGSILVVSSGNTWAGTLWQETAASGIVDTNANNWRSIGYVLPPPVYTPGNGLQQGSSSTQLAVKPGLGILATAGGGTAIDTTVVLRKYAVDVPAGSRVCTITHGLNTRDIASCMVWDKASGDLYLLCPTVTGNNTVSLEFAVAPTTGQYRCVLSG